MDQSNQESLPLQNYQDYVQNQPKSGLTSTQSTRQKYHQINQEDPESFQHNVIKSKSNSTINFSSFSLVLQCFPSLVFSVMGGILTGRLLEHVHDWNAFVRVPELYILLPVLMNLKGNLEMNLASRLSTSANIGDLDTTVGRKSMVIGNLGLLQVQALIVSLIASLLSFILGLLSRNNLSSIKKIPTPKPATNLKSNLNWNHKLQGGYYECLLVLAAGMLAAGINSALLGSLMCGLVILCRILRFNPDNITTPVAASLGDLLTLVFLSLAASVFIRYAESGISTVVFLILACSIVLHGYMTKKNTYVQGFLKVGWSPLFIAMMISSCTGLVLEHFVNELHGFSIIAPVLTGICGNIGTISISRISTSLHSNSSFSTTHPGDTVTTINKTKNKTTATTTTTNIGNSPTEFQKLELDDYSNDSIDLEDDLFITSIQDSNHLNEPVFKVGLILLLLSNIILGTFALLNPIFFDNFNHITLHQSIFFFGFIACVSWCSLLSLLMANFITKFLWEKGMDPDIYAIPIFTSLLDLVCHFSLVLTFILFKK